MNTDQHPPCSAQARRLAIFEGMTANLADKRARASKNV